MISSTKNQLVKRIRSLRQKKFRQQEGAYFVDGLRVVGAAVEAGAEIEQLIWCDALLTSDFGRTLICNSSIPATEVSEIVFRSISERENPVGIAAIVRSQRSGLDSLAVTKASLFVALNEIADPGNLGTIIRSVDALGADAVLLVGNTVDPWHPAVIKASMGAFFQVPLCQVDSIDALFGWAETQNVKTLATSAKGSVSSRNMSTDGSTLLLMGAEKMGLSAEVLARVDTAVSIPMNPDGVSSSLNLAVATGILLYELKSSACHQ